MTQWTTHAASWSWYVFSAPLDTYSSAPRTSYCGTSPWPSATISGASGSLKVGQFWNLTSNCGTSAKWTSSDPKVAVMDVDASTGTGLAYGVKAGEADIRVDCPVLKLYPAGIAITVEDPPPPETCGTAELLGPTSSNENSTAENHLAALRTGGAGPNSEEGCVPGGGGGDPPGGGGGNDPGSQ